MIELFFEFLMIGAMSFGGGYGTLSMIENSAVIRRGWLTSSQLHELIAISEVTPGPIALNAASFTGYSVGGPPGAVVATIGCILPSCAAAAVLVSFFSKHQNHPIIASVMKVIKAAVCAMIFSAFFSVFAGVINQDPIYLILFFAALIVSQKISPVLTIFLSGCAGLLFNLITSCADRL